VLFGLLQVLLAGMSAVQNGSETIRELAYLLVLALAQHHSHLFEPVLEVVLQPLLQGCGDDSREVRGLVTCLPCWWGYLAVLVLGTAV
jgi:hypothetical protein